MNITISINLHTSTPIEDTTKLAEILKNKNLRRTKVKQLTATPNTGELSTIEWSNIIVISISSGFALGTLKVIFDLLKGGLIELPKTKIEAKTKMRELEIRKEIELAKIASNERIEQAKTEQTAKYIELKIEANGRKYHFNLTRNDGEQEKIILDTIMALENMENDSNDNAKV